MLKRWLPLALLAALALGLSPGHIPLLESRRRLLASLVAAPLLVGLPLQVTGEPNPEAIELRRVLQQVRCASSSAGNGVTCAARRSPCAPSC